MAAKAWNSLSKKIMKFNEKFPACGVICFGLINNRFVYEGCQQMKLAFAQNYHVQDLYREAFLSHPSEDELVQLQPPPPSSPQSGSLFDFLALHVYDMDINIMRSIISNAVAPPTAMGAKDSRRNWYREENAPQWWKETGIPFQSVNQSMGASKKLTKAPLMKLIESYQSSNQIVPAPPLKKNTTEDINIFNTDASVLSLPVIESEHLPPPVSSAESAISPQSPERLSAQPTSEIAFFHPESEMTLPSTDSESIPTPTAAENVQPHQSQQAGITEKKLIISNVFKEEISMEEKILKVMKLFVTWDDLLALSSHVQKNLPVIPSQLANNWKPKELLKTNKRYKDYIPLSIGERQLLESTPNGNCIFNAVSTIVYGNEDMAMMLKLASILHIVDDLIPFSKYIVEEYGNEVWKWLNIAIFDPQTNEANATMDVEAACRKDILDALAHPYKDGSQLHLHLITPLLKRPVQQHCDKTGEAAYQMKQLLLPPLSAIARPSPLHIVWVPTKPRGKYSTYNHVVPAVCQVGPYGTYIEECAFEGLGCCAFQYNFNSDKSPAWVECTLCGQWVHEICMDVRADRFNATDSFPCGCDILLDGKVPIRSLDWYQSLSVDTLMIDFKELVGSTESRISLRKALYCVDGHCNLKLSLRRFGPFNEAFIKDLNEKLKEFVSIHPFIPDIYVPEVLIHIIQKKEEVNRLLAEMALVQYSLWKKLPSLPYSIVAYLLYCQFLLTNFTNCNPFS